MPQKIYKAVIIDDENKSRAVIRNYISEFGEDRIIITGEADSAASGKKLLQDSAPDLVFLDINLGDGSGFDLLDEQSGQKFRIIFITAYDQYAVKAFECYAMDYILKPIDPERFGKTVKRLFQTDLNNDYLKQIEDLLYFNQSGKIRKLTLKTEQGVEMISADTIIRMEADGSYTNIILENGEKIISSKPLGDLEGMLPEKQFFRCHKSHIIQLDKIRKFLKEDGGVIVMSNGDKVSLSRRNKEEFLKLLMGQ